MSILGISELETLANTIVGKLIPDKTQAEKDTAAAQMQLMLLASQERQAQNDTNKTEAGNKSLFVAGWRPAVGWACASAFFWSYVLAPMLTFLLASFGKQVHLPVLDISGMMPVLLGMLGLGGMRTAEKIKGINAGQ